MFRHSYATPASSSRSRLSARPSSRDTCIWEMPRCCGDLRLGQVAVEAQLQDPLLPFRQAGQGRPERLVRLDVALRRVLAAEPVADRPVLADRRRPATSAEYAALQSSASSTCSSVTPARAATSATVGARPSSWLRSRAQRSTSPAQHLQRPVHVHGPGAVAEVPADLAEDRRRGERAEREPATRVEPVHRLDQPDRRRPGAGRRTARCGRRTGGRSSGPAGGASRPAGCAASAAGARRPAMRPSAGTAVGRACACRPPSRGG